MESLHSSSTTPPDDSTLVDEFVLARLTGFVESAVPSAPISPVSVAAPLPFPGVAMPDSEDELGTPVINPALVGASPTGVGAGAPVVGGGEGSEEGAEEGDDDEVIDPRSQKTKSTMANSPLTRLGIVGGGVGAAVMVMVGLWSILSSGMNEKPAPKPSLTVAVDSSGMPVAGADAAALANAKSENALNGQRELLTNLNKGKPKPVKAVVKPTPIATPTPASAPIVTPPVVEAPPVAEPTPQVQTDPFTQWQQAATVGSFGQVSVATVTPPAPAAVTPPPASTLFAPTNNNNRSSSPSSSSSGARSISQLRSGADGSGLRSTPITPVLVGTSAAAELTTAIILTSDNSSAVNPDDPNSIKYLAKLNAPIKDSKGADAIPAGAQLILVATNFSPQSGTMAFQVKGVIVNNTEYSLSSGSMLVRGKDGALLALNKRGGKSGINLLGPIFAGLGQAAQMINQPTSSSVITGGVSTTTTTSSNRPNYAAGFAQGLGTSLSQQIQQQTQTAQQQAASSNSVSWQAGVGTQLQVVVNNTFEM